MIKKLLLIVLLISNTIISTAQIKIPNRPEKIPFIIDSTYTLDINQKSILNNKLKNYCLSTSTEILVMMVSSTNGIKIETYAKELGNKWGIGKLGKDNGIVLLIAKDDRKMTIQNGHGIEPILSNKKTKHIIDADITPHFKNGDFFMGISQGLNAIFDILKNEFTNENNAYPIDNFITDLNPPVEIQKIVEEPVESEDSNDGFTAFICAICLFLFTGSLLAAGVYGLLKRKENRIGYDDYTLSGNGISNNIYNSNHVHVNNGRSFFRRGYSSYGGGISTNRASSSGSSSSGSSYSSSSGDSSSSSSSSGSGGTFGGGGASGGW